MDVIISVVIGCCLLAIYSLCAAAGRADRQLEEYEAADRGEADEV